jgi:hypothetical protein
VTPAIDILVRTYFRDFRWLAHCLHSIENRVEGYRNVVIVMPPSSLDRSRRGDIPDRGRVIVRRCDEYTDDYLGQQITKLNADAFTDADYVAIVDSDCVFCAPCSLSSLFFEAGRAVVSYRRRSRRPVTDGWRVCVEEFHGTSLPFDALTTPPWLYPTSLFGELRASALRRHRMPIDHWVLGRSLDRVSEIGLLTRQAWLYRRGDFIWRDQSEADGWPCVAFWSRSPRAAATLAALSEKSGNLRR